MDVNVMIGMVYSFLKMSSLSVVLLVLLLPEE